LIKIGAVDANKPTNTTSAVSSNTLSPSLFAKDYTIDEIKSILDLIYTKAPQIVQDRANKIADLASGASEYIRLHYISEYNIK
jgi:hypothetical protein